MYTTDCTDVQRKFVAALSTRKLRSTYTHSDSPAAGSAGFLRLTSNRRHQPDQPDNFGGILPIQRVLGCKLRVH